MRDPRRYIIMMTTVVDYPAAFEVPSEYDPICDARWAWDGMEALGLCT